MSQLDYNDMSPSVQGGLADAGFNDIASEVSAEIIKFGWGVQVETTGLIAVPSAATDKFHGVALMKHKAKTNALGEAQYEIGQAVSILRKGRIWVYSEQAVNPTLAVFLRHTTTTTEIPGDFRVDLDTDKAFDISAYAKWISVTAAAGLAIVDINFP